MDLIGREMRKEMTDLHKDRNPKNSDGQWIKIGDALGGVVEKLIKAMGAQK